MTNVHGIPSMSALVEDVIRTQAQLLVAQDSWGQAVKGAQADGG